MNANENAAALVRCRESHRAEGRLTARHAICGRFNAVIYGVPDHVDKRIPEFFNDIAIEFRLFSVEDKLDLFFLVSANIPDESGHLLKRGTHRNHAEGHGVALKFGSGAAELTKAAGKCAAFETLDIWVLHYHGLGNHQLANKIDKGVELGGVELYKSGTLILDLNRFFGNRGSRVEVSDIDCDGGRWRVFWRNHLERLFGRLDLWRGSFLLRRFDG